MSLKGRLRTAVQVGDDRANGCDGGNSALTGNCEFLNSYRTGKRRGRYGSAS